MASPMIHAQSSAKRFKGRPEDYLSLHVLMDSTKEAFPDNRHRCLTHNSWFIQNIIPLIFGHQALNSDGKFYIPKEVAEFHVLEDYNMKFIPSVQDYLENMTLELWMQNGRGPGPNSRKRIPEPTPQSITISEEDIIGENIKEIIRKAAEDSPLVQSPKPKTFEDLTHTPKNPWMDGFERRKKLPPGYID